MVDGRRTCGARRRQRGSAIVDPVTDVMQSFPTLLDGAGDRGVRSRRRGELDVTVGHLQQRFLDAVAVDDLSMIDLGAERAAVVVDRRVEISNSDGDVV